jgi:hypothetical protein
MILAIEYVWRHWKLIVAGLALATMGLLLFLAKADARHWQKQADQNRALYDRETMAHAVTRTSLNMVQTALDDQSRAVRGIAADSEARIAASDTAREAAQVAARASERMAAALDASAAVARPGEPCAPSDVFWKQSRSDL